MHQLSQGVPDNPNQVLMWGDVVVGISPGYKVPRLRVPHTKVFSRR